MRITLNPKTTPFNLDHTLQCGQVFRWQKHYDWWYGIVAEKPLKIRQTHNVLEFEGTDTDFIKKYFRLDDPLPLILHKISKDAYIRKAVKNFHGLRLIRQDPWECLIAYICATYKNIPAIQNMIANLSKQFGHKNTLDDHTFYTFPTQKRLASDPHVPRSSSTCRERESILLQSAGRREAFLPGSTGAVWRWGVRRAA